jgi:hypothetical protein
VWTKRKRKDRFPTIGRVYNIHPTMGELYYLRLLLHNNYSLGAHDFSDLKTLSDGVIVHTYKEVCLRLGLLQDDGEWHEAMQEAVFTQMPETIRELFCIILEWCNPSNPVMLFEAFKDAMGEDYKKKYQDQEFFSNDVKYAMVMLDIEGRLHHQNKSLRDYNLLEVSEELHRASISLDENLWFAQLSPLIREEMSYNHEEELNAFQLDYQKLQDTQKTFAR